MCTCLYAVVQYRSPKDAAIVTKAQYTERLTYLESREPQSDRTNLQLRAYFEASTQALRVTSADEALSLFLASERVYTDLLEARAAFRKVRCYSKGVTTRYYIVSIYSDSIYFIEVLVDHI